MAPLLTEPLWLHGLSVDALLGILSRRPKEFIYFGDVAAGDEEHGAACGHVCAEAERESGTPMGHRAGCAQERHGQRDVWRPSLRSAACGRAPSSDPTPTWAQVVQRAQRAEEPKMHARPVFRARSAQRAAGPAPASFVGKAKRGGKKRKKDSGQEKPDEPIADDSGDNEEVPYDTGMKAATESSGQEKPDEPIADNITPGEGSGMQHFFIGDDDEQVVPRAQQKEVVKKHEEEAWRPAKAGRGAKRRVDAVARDEAARKAAHRKWHGRHFFGLKDETEATPQDAGDQTRLDAAAVRLQAFARGWLLRRRRGGDLYVRKASVKVTEPDAEGISAKAKRRARKTRRKEQRKEDDQILADAMEDAARERAALIAKAKRLSTLHASSRGVEYVDELDYAAFECEQCLDNFGVDDEVRFAFRRPGEQVASVWCEACVRIDVDVGLRRRHAGAAEEMPQQAERPRWADAEDDADTMDDEGYSVQQGDMVEQAAVATLELEAAERCERRGL